MIVHPWFRVEPWALHETSLKLDVIAQTESLFALSNFGGTIYVAEKDDIRNKTAALTGLLFGALWMSSAIYGYSHTSDCRAAKDEAEATRLIAHVETLKRTLEEQGEVEAQVGDLLRQMLAALPNLPADDVPEGQDEHANVEVRREFYISHQGGDVFASIHAADDGVVDVLDCLEHRLHRKAILGCRFLHGPAFVFHVADKPLGTRACPRDKQLTVARTDTFGQESVGLGKGGGRRHRFAS